MKKKEEKEEEHAHTRRGIWVEFSGIIYPGVVRLCVRLLTPTGTGYGSKGLLDKRGKWEWGTKMDGRGLMHMRHANTRCTPPIRLSYNISSAERQLSTNFVRVNISFPTY
eukprot:TRINITY_DN617_c0_g1_i18.p1 TRINITY_DN617_c0_g1~~TRINITY_DN617_c0_g1_i18.p1  ORF type:complete len:110 (+),score=9.08 TRINITY_DN617_c0_g1_i18:63-392(+)